MVYKKARIMGKVPGNQNKTKENKTTTLLI